MWGSYEVRPWRWRQVSSKCWYQHARLHIGTTKNAQVWLPTAM